MLGNEQGVTDLTNNTESALIHRQLVKARAELTAILSKSGITVPDTSIVLDTAVEYLASAIIALKPGAINPVSNFKTEDFSRSDWDTGSQSDVYYKKALKIIGDYVFDTNGGSISMPPQTIIVGVKGALVGDYEEYGGD